ncbi:MAG: hypothetical protein R3F60_21260 [bacterium]
MRHALPALALLLGACDDEPAGRLDARVVDARVVDARVVDARLVDARVVDARVVDARVVDARVVDARVVDARMVDAQVVDARVVDARVVDAARPDAQVVDAGPPDEVPDAAARPGIPDLGLDGAVGNPANGIEVGFDPTQNDAVTAYGQCLQLILDCTAAQGAVEDACVTGVRRCATDRPWEEADWCCAAACIDAYEAARRAGMAPFDALQASLVQHRECMPGVPPRRAP